MKRENDSTKKPLLGLYWCMTDDHHEDWFIAARSKQEAATLHEDAEGYGEGDASSEFVCDLPSRCQDAEPGWPSDELLEACGAEILPDPDGFSHIVRIAGKIYTAGNLAQSVALELGVIKAN